MFIKVYYIRENKTVFQKVAIKHLKSFIQHCNKMQYDIISFKYSFKDNLLQYFKNNFKKLFLAFYSIAITLFICYNFFAIEKSFAQSKIILDNLKNLYY